MVSVGRDHFHDRSIDQYPQAGVIQEHPKKIRLNKRRVAKKPEGQALVIVSPGSLPDITLK
ncbi:uncharacterized protein CIMG_12760 [Coccidioides immitis RS]|uniref:Uncharacterized protein n=1 Tax=Coccidioides immitis (strain RS) TaxID=246410 RepID=J3KJU7_COCIM|nr:uncharacterized protein CIMG_12760 [Coccidioides immitis RS]EAS36392.3 hypothetical protein CIMG_12760 [Coccidioides immitis RS]